jgi:hypothetical protein
MTFRDCFSTVNDVRDLQLNAGFETQLEDFEKSNFKL